MKPRTASAPLPPAATLPGVYGPPQHASIIRLHSPPSVITPPKASLFGSKMMAVRPEDIGIAIVALKSIEMPVADSGARPEMPPTGVFAAADVEVNAEEERRSAAVVMGDEGDSSVSLVMDDEEEDPNAGLIMDDDDDGIN